MKELAITMIAFAVVLVLLYVWTSGGWANGDLLQTLQRVNAIPLR